MDLKVSRFVMGLLFALSAVSWLIALAGLSAVQNACGRYGYNRFGAGVGSMPGPGPNQCPTTNFLACTPDCVVLGSGNHYCTYFSGGVGCSKFFAYQWWQLGLQTFVLGYTGFVTLSKKPFHGFSRTGLIALLVVATLQMIDFTNNFYYLSNTAGIYNSPGSGNTRIETALAGGMMTCMCNFATLLIVAAYDDQGGASATGGEGAAAPAEGEEGGEYTAPAAPEERSARKGEAEMTPVKGDNGKAPAEDYNAPATPTI